MVLEIWLRESSLKEGIFRSTGWPEYAARSHIGRASVNVNDCLIETRCTVHHPFLKNWCRSVQVLLALLMRVVEVWNATLLGLKTLHTFVDVILSSSKALASPLPKVAWIDLRGVYRVGTVHVVSQRSQVIPIIFIQGLKDNKVSSKFQSSY